MTACDRLGCKAEARWLPVIVVRAPYELRNNTPADCILALGICDVHRETTTLEDFLSEVGWRQICDGFAAIGRAVPELDRTTLRFEPLDSPDALVRSFARRVAQRQGRS